MNEKSPITIRQLARIGMILFGVGWQTHMAKAVHASPRTVRRWAVGEFPVPYRVELELRDLLEKKRGAIAEILLSFD